MEEIVNKRKNPEYRAKNSAYMKAYMARSPDNVCEICGGKYKSYQKYRHVLGKVHKLVESKMNL